MKNFTFLFALLFFVHFNSFFGQTNLNQEKIGIIFKIEGPFKIYRNGPLNITYNEENNEYNDAINF